MILQDTHAIRTGAILECKKGHRWICVGWADSDSSSSPKPRKAVVLVRDVTGLHGVSGVKDRMWVRTCSLTETFEEHYPASDDYRI